MIAQQQFDDASRFKEIKLFALCFLIFLNELESMVRSWINACLVEIQITRSIHHLHALYTSHVLQM